MCSFIWRHTMYYRRAGSNKKATNMFSEEGNEINYLHMPASRQLLMPASCISSGVMHPFSIPKAHAGSVLP